MRVETFLRLAGGLALVGAAAGAAADDDDNPARAGALRAGGAALGLGAAGIFWIADKLLIEEAGGRIVGEIRDKVLEPEIGSVVYCDYVGFQHTGIYVGNGLIVSLKKNGKNAVVTKEHAADFIKGKKPQKIFTSFVKGKNLLGIRKSLKEQ